MLAARTCRPRFVKVDPSAFSAPANRMLVSNVPPMGMVLESALLAPTMRGSSIEFYSREVPANPVTSEARAV